MMTFSQAAKIVNGHMNRPGDSELYFSSVATDSRSQLDNALFVAIRGEHFDGHDFVQEAKEKGAVCALVEHDIDVPITQIKVQDVTVAMGQLAQYWRSHFVFPVIGITGSNGKTTVSSMVATILRQGGECLSPAGSYNNHWGVPITLLQMKHVYDFAVIEMGMNHVGEIDYLSRITQPSIALINNIACAHLEGLGSMDNIAHAKQEIFNGLLYGGTAIINLDEPYHELWLKNLHELRPDVQIFTFSAEQNADLQMLDLVSQGFTSEFTLRYCDYDTKVMLNVPGVHNARNALAAAACSIAAGATVSAVASGLRVYKAVNQRVQIKKGMNDSVIIDDSFNANPSSMQAGIDLLCQYNEKCSKRIAVLGNMAELGDDAAALHSSIGKYAVKKQVDYLMVLHEGEEQYAKFYAQDCAFAQVFNDVDALIAKLITLLDDKTFVLIKGSKSAKMNRVVAAIANGEEVFGGQIC